MNDAFLGIEIGATKLQVAAGVSPAQIIRRERLEVDRERGAAGIQSQVEGVLAKWADLRWRGVGVGFGGPVDWRTGRVCRSMQVSGWDGMDLTGWLKDLTDAPVAVDNDANVAALAEALFGAGWDQTPVFYTNSGSGVGGGLVLNGAIYHGVPPGEVEFGHLLLHPGGPTVESHCSGWAVGRKIRARCAEVPHSPLTRLVSETRGGDEARHLREALETGDALARAIVNETAADLAFALSHVVHLFHPAIIVLGGGLSLIGEEWRLAVEAALPAHLTPAFQPPPVQLAALGEDVVPLGALALAIQMNWPSSLAAARYSA
ncbi:MAG: ROK family protein [Planctomycetaceae bacterium]